MEKAELLPESNYLPKTAFKLEERVLVIIQFQGINTNENTTKR